MKKFLQRNRDFLVLAVITIILALMVLNAFKYNLISWDIISNNKDAISSISSIVTTATILIGALFSYYRFFKGRTFSARADITIKVSVHDTPDNYYIHAIEVILKNVGSTSIWSPELKLSVNVHGDESIARSFIVDLWWDPGSKIIEIPPMSLVDSEESATFLTNQEISKRSWAVTYIAIVTSARNTVWQKAITISNYPEVFLPPNKSIKS